MRTFTLADHPGPLTLPDRPTTDDFDPLPHGLTLDDAVAVRAHQVRPGDLLIAEFTDGTGVRPTEHIPGPCPADPRPLSGCPCEGCETCDEVTAWTLGDHSRTADTLWRFVCLAPSEDGEPCTIVLRNRPVAVIPADTVARAQAALPRASTAGLAPRSAFDDAETVLRAAAKAMLALVATTLHHQFPTAAYLVLTRPADHDDYDAVRLDSVRDTRGGILRTFQESAQDDGLLPDVAEEFATLWGDADPRQTSDVLGLVQRADQVAPYEFLAFLPPSAMRGDEANAERTPLGIPLGPDARTEEPGVTVTGPSGTPHTVPAAEFTAALYAWNTGHPHAIGPDDSDTTPVPVTVDATTTEIHPGPLRLLTALITDQRAAFADPEGLCPHCAGTGSAAHATGPDPADLDPYQGSDGHLYHGFGEPDIEATAEATADVSEATSEAAAQAHGHSRGSGR
ncbi:hypothetical protein [Streptomyces sp. S1D4-20]|uniref:hypothetical protein n=1 Tax=Streptomyces sp. S1D4-20 TaxID=2594462 RepID=UPI00116534E2|nr:hypothetical protein [Streptomyces sp. S1D4-20]QDN54052.1 hypothetical protein FNV67_00285 [Streptomyces sp. S1D4-20]